MQSGMAPETGLEPVTRRLIPTCRDSTTEQNLANPFSGFHALNCFFAFSVRRATALLLSPLSLHALFLSTKLPKRAIGSIMGEHACLQVISMTDVKLVGRILEKENSIWHAERNGSRDRTRTCNPPVNPDVSGLYH